MNSKYSSTKSVTTFRSGSAMCTTHLVSPFDELKTNCGVKLDPARQHSTISMFGTGWTLTNDFDLSENCQRCRKSEMSPCETSDALTLTNWPERKYGSEVRNHKFHIAVLKDGTPVPTICVKCGATADSLKASA